MRGTESQSKKYLSHLSQGKVQLVVDLLQMNKYWLAELGMFLWGKKTLIHI